MNTRIGRRLISKHGTDATVYHYAVDPDSADDYGDPDVTEQATSTNAIFDLKRAQIIEIVRETGRTDDTQPEIFVPDTISDEVGATRPDTIPEVDQPPEIVNETSGVRYQVSGSFDEGNGIVRCICEEVGFDE